MTVLDAAPAALNVMTPTVPTVPTLPTAAAPPIDAAKPVMPGTQRFVITGAALALGIAALYYGRSLLMPLAFAALLAFVLDPVVTALRRWRLPHALAVGLVMALTIAGLGLSAVLLGQQVVALSQDIPAYQSTIRKKLRDLRPDADSSRILSDASRVIGMVEGELSKVRDDAAGAAAGAAGSAGGSAAGAGGAAPKVSAPTRVRVEPTPPSPLRAIVNIVSPVVLPLATAGLVAVLAIFLLLQRHEMRDRLVRLLGGDLHHMADVMNEAAHRVSRYLGAQLLVNIGYGVPMVLGLWVIGVPGAVLWGFLSGVLRFVPYLGPAVAALFPLLLAFAVDPGWGMMAWTAALILFMELVSNNIVEPLAYGSSTGVSPVAVLLSAGFWALIWGPVGLVLATPLTVCLLVLGRHLAPLRFLELLLGTEPVFDKPTQLYQRLISGDLEEAIELCHQEVARGSLVQFYSDSAVPMLALAAKPSSRRATAAQRHRVVSGVSQVLQDLRAGHPALAAEVGAMDAKTAAAAATRVLCIGARNEIDTLSAEMLAHTLAAAGCSASAVPALAVSAERIDELDLEGVGTVCLCAFSATPQMHTRFVSRRLRRRAPGLRVLLAAWSAPTELLLPDAAAALGVDAVAVSLAEAQGRLAPPLVAINSAPVQVDAEPSLAVPEGVNTAAGTAALAAMDGALADLRNTLARGAQQAAEVFSAPLATASFHTPAMGPLHCSAGLPEWTSRAGQPPRADGGPADDRDPVLDHVMATGEPLVVPDRARDPAFATRLDPHRSGLSFCAAAPLHGQDGAVVGVLAIHDTSARPFTQGDRDLLAAMALELWSSVAAEMGLAAATARESEEPLLPATDTPAVANT